jgi:hypothetical protein
MATTKLLNANLVLNQKLTDAVLEAIKAGMDQADVLAVVQRLAEMIEQGEE